MFNVPTVVLAILAALFFIQGVREWVLSEEQNLDVLVYFAFIPARYDASQLGQEVFPGGTGRKSGPSSPMPSCMPTSCMSR